MSVFVVVIVLIAALMHALWNALVKGSGDQTVVLGLIALGHVIPGAFLVLSLPFPAQESWPYIFASTVIHWGYYYLLNMAYRSGDLSIIYPIARGAAPILIAVGAWVWIGETLPLTSWIGIGAISFGIFLLSRPSAVAHVPRSGILAAFGAAVTVAAYSIADGIGVRASGHALAYVGWLFLAEIFVAAYVLSSRWTRFRKLGARKALVGFAGGVISGAAYALALYAKTLAPLGLVSATRETSVIFAALIGVAWFKEGPAQRRMLAAMVVTAGVVLIAFKGTH